MTDGHRTVDIRSPAPPYFAQYACWWWWLGLYCRKYAAACVGAPVWHIMTSAHHMNFYFFLSNHLHLAYIIFYHIGIYFNDAALSNYIRQCSIV